MLDDESQIIAQEIFEDVANEYMEELDDDDDFDEDDDVSIMPKIWKRSA